MMVCEKAPGASRENAILSGLSSSTPLLTPHLCSRKACLLSRSMRYNMAKGISSAFFARVEKAEAHAPSTDFSIRDFAVSSDRVPKRRALITLGVTSVHGQIIPLTFPYL